jgi:hypothetical protein
VGVGVVGSGDGVSMGVAVGVGVIAANVLTETSFEKPDTSVPLPLARTRK